MMRFPAVLLLLALACTDKPRVDRPRLPIDSAADTTVSGVIPDSVPTPLDSVIADLPPVQSVETLVTPVPVIDTTPVIVPETTFVIDTTTRPDTAIVVVIAPPRGIPFGPFDLFKSSAVRPDVGGFTAAVNYMTPRTILAALDGYRTHKIRAVLKLTGESHGDPDGTDAYRTAGRFDRTKWEAALRKYDTPDIRKAIARGVKDGWLLCSSMIDEPNHTTWGGVFTKALIDSLARVSRSLFPTLPTCLVAPYYWRAGETYQDLDAMIVQTWKPKGKPGPWVDSAVTAARKNGTALILSLNLRGMAETPGCVSGGTRACLATAQEIRDWLTAFAKAPKTVLCGVTLWRYDAPTSSSSAWKYPDRAAALTDAQALLGQQSARPCTRL